MSTEDKKTQSSQNLNLIRRKSIAVGSGKGGAGKTTTAVNLAIYYAKKGIRTGLIDLDPLSDIATILDLEEPEKVLEKSGFESDEKNLRNFSSRIFKNLDLIFPESKLNTDSKLLLQKLYSQFVNHLKNDYDIIIFDMPAGNRYEDNLAFLPYIGNIVVVTVAEPTSHVSAGSYIKNILGLDTKININLLHNKFQGSAVTGFNSKDVLGNYNKNVSADFKINDGNIPKIKTLGFIPKDPSLDLLQGNPSIIINIQGNILDGLEIIQEARLTFLLRELIIYGKAFDLIKFFLIHNKQIGNIEGYVDGLSDYLKTLIDGTRTAEQVKNDESVNKSPDVIIFSESQKKVLHTILRSVKKDKLRDYVLSLIKRLEAVIQKQEESKRPFAVGDSVGPNKAVEKKITRLLMYMNSTLSRTDIFMKNAGGMLLFHFSLYKLFQSGTVVKLVGSLIPTKKNSRGVTVRDKLAQIKNLVENDKEYKKKYFTLIKILFPLLCRQISTIVKTFELPALVFRNENGKLKKEVYVKLLNNFVHDTINSGTSVIVGFRYRPASIAFHDAAEKLFAIAGGG